MKRLSIKEIHDRQTEHQSKVFPKKLENRKKTLSRLYNVIEDYRTDILKALDKDLKKCEYESELSEIEYVLGDIKFALKHLDSWASPKKVGHPAFLLPGSSKVISEPLGRILIISPWNYPFQLLISPAIYAIAAGNSVVLKPSEISSHTSQCIYDMISNNFAVEELAVVEGAIPETNELLEKNWDHIFYTGNEHVARIIMEKAAKNLTPVTLELGGKSPLLVYDCKDLDSAARRIVWAKYFNTGQTCVAPDYLLCDSSTKQKLLPLLSKYIQKFYGKDPSQSPDYGRIVSDKHFQRLRGLVDSEKIIYGGKFNEEARYIEPSVLEASGDEAIMKEEIFGPLLPVIEIDDFNSAIQFVKNRPKPLSAYLFSDNDKRIDVFQKKVSAGGMLINECIVHLANHHLPFGGVGISGMGNYHGFYGFRCFSHEKAFMKRSFFMDLDLRYPPYEDKIQKLKSIMKLLGT